MKYFKNIINMVKLDLKIILKEAVDVSIPCVIGSTGGSGAQPDLAWPEQIVKEIAIEEGLFFKMVVINTDMRTICIAGVRDPLLIGQLDNVMEKDNILCF